MGAWRAQPEFRRRVANLASAVIPLRQSAVDAALKQAAFEAFAFPAVCLNAAGQMLAANSAFSALVDSESLVGRHVSDLIGAPGPVAQSN